MRELGFSATLLQARRWGLDVLRAVPATGVLTAALIVSAVGAQTALGKAPSAGDRPPANLESESLHIYSSY